MPNYTEEELLAMSAGYPAYDVADKPKYFSAEGYETPPPPDFPVDGPATTVYDARSAMSGEAPQAMPAPLNDMTGSYDQPERPLTPMLTNVPATRDTAVANDREVKFMPPPKPTEAQMSHATKWGQKKGMIAELIGKQYGIRPDAPPPLNNPVAMKAWTLANVKYKEAHTETQKLEERAYRESREDLRDTRRDERDANREAKRDERDAAKEEAKANKPLTPSERIRLGDYVAAITKGNADPNPSDLAVINDLADRGGYEFKKVTKTSPITRGIPGIDWFDKKSTETTTQWQLVPKSGAAASPNGMSKSSVKSDTHVLSGQKAGRYKIGGKEVKWDGSKEI